MPTKKETTDAEAAARALVNEGIRKYEEALQTYSSGLEHLRKGDFARAKEFFAQIEAAGLDEPELVERARTYSRICEKRLLSEAPPPSTPDECYYQAVLLANDGRLDEAIALYDRVVQADPMSVRTLYARACSWAMKGTADRAVADLRQAIAVDPKVRFQAVNDPDFEKIREEPAFIDIIEPTPTGA